MSCLDPKTCGFEGFLNGGRSALLRSSSNRGNRYGVSMMTPSMTTTIDTSSTTGGSIRSGNDGGDPNGVCRFQSFRGAIPQVEIQAVCSLLAFITGAVVDPSSPQQQQLSSVNTITAATSTYRWRLIKALLFSKAGVLGGRVAAVT